MVSESQRILHFYNRAGFGLPTQFFGREHDLKLKQERRNFLKEGVADMPLRVFKENPFLKLKEVSAGGQKGRQTLRKAYSKTVQDGRKQFRSLNIMWMQQMLDPQLMLREKLTFFWHDHFGVRVNNAYHAQLHNNLLRKHALGKYGELLKAVAKDAAMMSFLNTQQNSKRQPNENFARELFELYTLGRGNYTETDIQNAARAFTGWKYDRFDFNFRLIERQHDTSTKTILGQEGSFDGEEVIDILLANRQTAHHLATKLFQFYVSDIPDQEIIALMSERLFKTDYDIGGLLDFIFSSDWFYQDRLINSKIKSPIELINSLRIHLGLKYERPGALVYLQNSFDQRLFFPPSVNGWPVGREWINSASLVQRMRLPAALIDRADLETRFKESLDNTNPAKGLTARLLQTGTTNWAVFEKVLGKKSLKEATDSLIPYLTNQRGLQPEVEQMILEKAEKSEQPIKSLIVSITALPAYQLA